MVYHVYNARRRGDVKNCIANSKIQSTEKSFFSSIRTKNDIEAEDLYTEFPKITSMQPLMKTEYDLLINKPFYVSSLTWVAATPAFTVLGSIPFPSIVNGNDLASIPFKTAAKYRLKACVMVQVMGTPQHTGMLFVATRPQYSESLERNTFNSYLQGPHAFLAANEATPVCLEIPFYSNTKLLNTCHNSKGSTYQDGLDYATITVGVLNPLTSSGTQNLSVSVHIMFKDAEFYVPKNYNIIYNAIPPAALRSTTKDIKGINLYNLEAQSDTSVEKECCLCCVRGFLSCVCSKLCSYAYNEATEFAAQSIVPSKTITNVLDNVTSGLKNITTDFIDNARKYLKSYTGLHNPNIGAPSKRTLVGLRNFPNNVDVPVFYEKLDTFVDHDRVLVEPTFCTSTDEMLISNIIQKPQFISTFGLSSSTTAGTLLFSRPITPCQESYTFASSNLSTPMQILSAMSMYWKGGIKLHLQASMNNFNCCRLMIARNYVPHPDVATKLPAMDSMVNLLTETVEFSAGGQVQTIDLPYCSELNQIQTPKDPITNANCHGMYYIYLLQPLVSGPNAPTEVQFNVYISAADDFQFYGLSTQLLTLHDSPSSSLLNGKVVHSSKKHLQRVLKPNDDKNLYNIHTAIERLAVIKEEQTAKEKAAIKLAASRDKLVKLLSQHQGLDETSAADWEVKTKAALDTLKLKMLPQAETTVAVSTQEALLNDSTEASLIPDQSQFKPLVSMRDFIRRLVPCPRLLMEGSFLESGISIIPVSDLLKDSSNSKVSYGRLARHFYLGASGGVKVKLVVSGCKDAIVRYLPPAYFYDGTGSYPSFETSHPNTTSVSVNKDIAKPLRYPRNTGAETDDPSPLPYIEIGTNHKHVASLVDGTETSAINEFVFEFTVPFNNTLNFVGTASINSVTTTAGYAGALGYILLSVNETNSTDGIIPFPVTIQPYVGYTDETRFGFNVFSPKVSYGAATYSGVHYQTDPFAGVDRAPFVFGTDAVAPGAFFTHT